MRNSSNLSSIGKSVIINPSQKSIKSKISFIDKKTKSPNTTRIKSSFKKTKSTKSEYSIYDFSVLQYKDGSILKDAVNSNPGYGLWAINIDDKEKANENSNSDKIKKYNFKLNNSIDKKLIEELKFRVDDLEKKLSNTLSQTKEKETISFNNEKLIKEFENLVTENTRETMLISYEKNLLENQAKSLRSALRNATNEIDILNREIRKDEQNCKNLYIDYEKKVEEEKKEEDNFKKIIMEKEKEINRLSIKKEQDSFNKNLTTNNSNNKSKIDLKEFFEKNSTMFGENQKMKMEISALNDIILNLQIEIANLKRKLYKLEEDENKLKEIIEYKDKKANYLQKNINDLNKQVLIKNMQSKSNRKIIMKKENELINIQNHLIEGEKVNEINNDVKDGEDEFV